MHRCPLRAARAPSPGPQPLLHRDGADAAAVGSHLLQGPQAHGQVQEACVGAPPREVRAGSRGTRARSRSEGVRLLFVFGPRSAARHDSAAALQSPLLTRFPNLLASFSWSFPCKGAAFFILATSIANSTSQHFDTASDHASVSQADLDLYREVHEQVNTADDASNSSSREREHTTPPGLRRILDAAVKVCSICMECICLRHQSWVMSTTSLSGAHWRVPCCACAQSYGALARGQRPPAMEVRERPMIPLETEAQNNSERQETFAMSAESRAFSTWSASGNRHGDMVIEYHLQTMDDSLKPFQSRAL
eukprot:6186631-Pleurochrysis_carterae.AAC.6